MYLTEQKLILKTISSKLKTGLYRHTFYNTQPDRLKKSIATIKTLLSYKQRFPQNLGIGQFAVDPVGAHQRNAADRHGYGRDV